MTLGELVHLALVRPKPVEKIRAVKQEFSDRPIYLSVDTKVPQRRRRSKVAQKTSGTRRTNYV